jgi:hypothetical protein
MDKLRLPDSLLGLLAQTRSAADPQASWAAAYRERNLNEALRLLEAELQESPQAVEQRLWWVLLQLELLQVPLTALTSPLLEMFPALQEQSRLHRTALTAFVSLAAHLAEKNQLRLGVVMLEHALELAALPETLSAAQENDLRQYFLEFLTEESARAEKRRENPDYLARLREKQQQIRSLAPRVVAEKKVKERKKQLNAKAIYAEAAAAETPPELALDMKDIRADALIAPGSQPESLSSAAPLAEKPRSRIVSGAIMAAGCIMLLLGYRNFTALFSRPSSANGELVLAMSSRFSSDSELVPPDAEPNAHDKLARRLETMNSAVEQVGERIKQLNPDAGNSKTLEQVSQDPQVDHAALASSAGAKLRPVTEDELVSLDGPKSRRTAEVRADPRRTPRLDPAGLSSIPVERMDITPSLNQRELHVGSDGRLYGPPENKDPVPEADAHTRALDGSPLRSYEVKEYDKPILYKTIAPTNVLSAPSLLSAAVSHLETDTAIHVVSRMGQWLELRSNQGRRGYIFAQDAVPADNNSPTQ